MFRKKRILLPRHEAEGFLPQDRQSSELVAKGYLDLTYRIDDVSGSIGYAEIVIGDIAIQRSEDMPVKGIGNIYLEY